MNEEIRKAILDLREGAPEAWDALVADVVNRSAVGMALCFALARICLKRVRATEHDEQVTYGVIAAAAAAWLVYPVVQIGILTLDLVGPDLALLEIIR